MISDSVHRSGMYSAKIAPGKEFTTCYQARFKDLGEVMPKYVILEYYAYHPGKQKVEAYAVCTIDKNDTTLAWQSKPLPSLIEKVPGWRKEAIRFVIPDGLNREPSLKIYFWNPKRTSFFIDDLKVDFN